MAQFKVLRPIEFDGKLYLSEGSTKPARPGGVRSAGNGVKIAVDTSGVIDLSPEAAAQMTLGQVQPIAPAKKKKM